MDNLTTQNQKIQFKSFILHENGLEIAGDPSFEEWIECGNFIKRARGAVHFWIGDWLNYGERKWGEKYKEAIQQTGFDYSTLRDDKWVTSQIPPERRKEALSFDHHRSVANLDEDEQDELLEKAVNENIATKDFRKVVDGNNLSWRHDKQGEKEEEKKDPWTEQEATIFAYATTFLGHLDQTDFDSMEKEIREPILKILKQIKDKIVGLEIKYD